MSSSIYRFTLDLHSTQSQVSLPVTRGDTARVFLISLSDGGLPFTIEEGGLAMLSVKRPSGNNFEAFCTIEDGTTIKYDFEQNPNTAVVEGIHGCTITLFDPERREIASPRFTMIVSERVTNYDDINIPDEEQTLVDAMIAEEASRQNAEEGRVNAEAQRVANEEAREVAEATREEAEESRVYAENSRAEAETARVLAENARVSVEDSRVEAENARVSAENARVEAENARVSVEDSRVDAENARVLAENARVEAEKSRVEAEEARVDAEEARVIAEQEREATLNDTLLQMNSKIAEFEAEADQVLADTLSQMDSKVTEFKAEADQALEDTRLQMESKVSKFEANANQALNNTLAQMDSKFAEFEAEANQALNDTLSQVDSKFAEFETETNQTLSDTISQMDSKLAEFEDDANQALSNTLAQVDSKLAEAEADTNHVRKRLVNLEARLSDDAFIEDSDIAVEKAVPDNVAPYAEIVKIGGMSYRDEATSTLKHAKVTQLKSVSKNLAFSRGWSAKSSSFVLTNDYGTTISATTGDTITVTQSKQGKPDNDIHFDNGFVIFALDGELKEGEKYRLSCDITIKENPLSRSNIYMMPNGQSNGATRVNFIGSDKQRITATFTYNIHSNLSNGHFLEFRCMGMSFDLGNVMITREEDTDITYTPPIVLGTFAIPEAVRNLEDYGLGVSGEYYNHIEYTEDGKVKYVQMCKKVVFDGTETWFTNDTKNGFKRVYATLPENEMSVKAWVVGSFICNHYPTLTAESTWMENTGCSVQNKYAQFYDENYQTASAWKAHLAELYAQGNPLTIVYALAEPIVPDITKQMPRDNLIKVQSGGMLTSVNENALAAPTTIIYQREG